MAEPRIRPGIRAVEHDDPVAGIEDDIARLSRRLRVVSRKACSDGADLLEAAVLRAGAFTAVQVFNDYSIIPCCFRTIVTLSCWYQILLVFSMIILR